MADIWEIAKRSEKHTINLLSCLLIFNAIHTLGIVENKINLLKNK